MKKIAFSAKKSDGFNPSLTICDEVASWQGDQGLKQYEVAEELDLPSNDAGAVVLTAMKRADYITFPTTQRSLGVAGAHQQAAPLAAAITTPPQRSNAAT